VKIPCWDVSCPKNYSPDPNDKCICKCNASPVVPCGRGKKWDLTVCHCIPWCDYIKQCNSKTEIWSFKTCSCVKACRISCKDKNFTPDPDQNCECLCNLPAQICPTGYEWSKKTCSCVKDCSKIVCKGLNEPDPTQNCKCVCLKMPLSCPAGWTWYYELCQCVKN
jgi:hypothetical protein